MTDNVYVYDYLLEIEPDKVASFIGDLLAQGLVDSSQGVTLAEVLSNLSYRRLELQLQTRNLKSANPRNHNVMISHSKTITNHDIRILLTMARHFTEDSYVEWYTPEADHFKWEFADGKIIESTGYLMYSHPKKEITL